MDPRTTTPNRQHRRAQNRNAHSPLNRSQHPTLLSRIEPRPSLLSRISPGPIPLIQPSGPTTLPPRPLSSKSNPGPSSRIPLLLRLTDPPPHSQPSPSRNRPSSPTKQSNPTDGIRWTEASLLSSPAQGPANPSQTTIPQSKAPAKANPAGSRSRVSPPASTRLTTPFPLSQDGTRTGTSPLGSSRIQPPLPLSQLSLTCKEDNRAQDRDRSSEPQPPEDKRGLTRTKEAPHQPSTPLHWGTLMGPDDETWEDLLRPQE